MSEAENPYPPPSPWLKLPDDVKANILHRLDTQEILDTVQNVCRDWRRVCKDPSMWRVIKLWGDWEENLESWDERCRRAVDLSQGQLIKIYLENFGTDDLLMYISERCNLLKCLELEFTCMSSKGIAEASRRFPELEDLHVYGTILTVEDIEIIGTSCRKLKAFTGFTVEIFRYNIGFNGGEALGRTGVAVDTNGAALAIAKNMSNLHHLRFRDYTDNVGLEAILNSCPHLKSLVMNGSRDIDLSGDLGKRCSQQLKHFNVILYDD